MTSSRPPRPRSAATTARHRQAGGRHSTAMIRVLLAGLLLVGAHAGSAQDRWFVNDDGDAESPKAVENDRTFLLYMCEPGGGGRLNPDGDLLALVSYAGNFESTTAVVNGRRTTAMPLRVSDYGMLYFAGAAPILQAINGMQLRVEVEERILGMKSTMTYTFPLDGSAEAIRRVGRGCGR